MEVGKAYRIAKKYTKMHWKDHTQVHILGAGRTDNGWFLCFAPFLPGPKGTDYPIKESVTVSGVTGMFPTYYDGWLPYLLIHDDGTCEEMFVSSEAFITGEIEDFCENKVKWISMEELFSYRKSKGKGYKIEQ